MTEPFEPIPTLQLTPVTPEQTLALLRCIACYQAEVDHARERAGLRYQGIRVMLRWIEVILMINPDDPEHEPLKTWLVARYQEHLQDLKV